MRACVRACVRVCVCVCVCVQSLVPYGWKPYLTGLTKAARLQMERMERSVANVQEKFSTVRTGRANPNVLDRVMARPLPELPTAP